MDEPRKPMTVREAGRKGGQATRERHGEQFYQEIGRKGGETVKRLMAAGRAAVAAETPNGE